MPSRTPATPRASGKPYFAAWLALIALTASSAGAAQLGLSDSAGLLVALVIAAIKAGVVLLIFMHLTREHFAVRMIALLNVLWVVLICVGIYADVGLRY